MPSFFLTCPKCECRYTLTCRALVSVERCPICGQIYEPISQAPPPSDKEYLLSVAATLRDARLERIAKRL